MSETKEQTPDRPAGLRSAGTPFRLLQRWMSADRRARFQRRLVRDTAAVLVFLASFYTAVFMENDARGALVLSLLISAVFSAICVLVHELGHAAAARVVGWRVHLIVVGPLAFAPRRGRFVRVAGRGRRQDIGGWVNATPPPGRAWTDGDIPFILGGAIGNLVLAIASVLAALALYEAERRAATGLLGLAAISMVFAVANLVPLRGPGRNRNDGALLIDALKREEPPLCDQNIARLAGMINDGVSAAEWDVSALNDLADDPTVNRDEVDPLLISYALAVADLAALKSILERSLEAKPEAPAEYICLYAFAIAMIDRDGPRAAEILEKVPAKLAKKSFCYWRAQAATAHLLDRRDEALAAISNARRVVGKLGARPDEDDEAVFRAIELGEELPRLEPRGRLSAGLTGEGATSGGLRKQASGSRRHSFAKRIVPGRRPV